MPRRIQLRRTRGWRKPPGAVVVSRPSKWGNPFRIGDPAKGGLTRQEAVVAYRHMARSNLDESELAELRGHDLACWCPLDQPCHADVLLELANSGGHMEEPKPDEDTEGHRRHSETPCLG